MAPSKKRTDTAKLLETVKKQEQSSRTYSSKWTLRPGDRGFNAQATRIMRQRGLYYGDRLKTTCSKGDAKAPFAHTLTAAWMAGPETPMDRLLVIHRTGSGKTMAMIHILDLYFSDPRAKVVVFPNNELVNNFYSKLKDERTQYSAFVETRASDTRHANTMKYFRETLGMEGELHKRGNVGELASPIRPMTYSRAGGRTVFPKGGGAPTLPMFKIGYEGRNPFDNKIIVCDEIHNLIRPSISTDKRLLTRLETMRKAIYTARNSVIVGLTATPFVKTKDDGIALLKMIKGREYANSPTNEGFVSYFNTLPTTIYPKVYPGTNAMNVVQIQMEPINLKKYLQKTKERNMSKDPDKKRAQLFSLMNYCNMAGYYTQASKGEFKKRLQHDSLNYATKLHEIALDAFKVKEKTAILIHRRLGFNALKQVMIGLDPKNNNRYAFMGKPKTKREEKDNPILKEFNSSDNKRGDKIRILVLDSETFNEGVDLLGVRYFFLANPAATYSMYKQAVGRVLRACGYSNLSASERNVEISMYIASTGDKDKKTTDEILFEQMREETIKREKDMKDIFGTIATDRIVLGFK